MTKPRQYEKELAQTFPFSLEELVNLRDTVDGYLAAWDVSRSNRNRRTVLDAALHAAKHRNATVDQLFRDLPKGT